MEQGGCTEGRKSSCPRFPCRTRARGGGRSEGVEGIDCGWKVSNTHYLASGMHLPRNTGRAPPTARALLPAATHSLQLTRSPAVVRQVPCRLRTFGVRSCHRGRMTASSPAVHSAPLAAPLLLPPPTLLLSARHSTGGIPCTPPPSSPPSSLRPSRPRDRWHGRSWPPRWGIHAWMLRPSRQAFSARLFLWLCTAAATHTQRRAPGEHSSLCASAGRAAIQKGRSPSTCTRAPWWTQPSPGEAVARGH